MKPHCPYCTEDITFDEIRCPSCGVTFGLDTLILVKRLVREATMEFPGGERKQYRVPKTFKVTYSSPDALVNSYLSNIGEGGVFIPSKNPLKLKETVNLKIHIPDEEKQLEISGEVVWSNMKERVTPEGTLPAGMGIKFFELSREDKESIIGILGRSLA